MSYSLRLTREAVEDLQRIEEFLVDLARRHSDFDLPIRAVDAILSEMQVLERNPYTCCKAGSNPLERELVIPCGGSGFVALFEIISDHAVAVSAVRHQREDAYH